MSHFNTVELLPEDAIFNLPILFAADKHLKKVNLGIGSYKDAHGKPVVLECVRQAEQLIINKKLDKEYLPIAGDPNYITALLKLILGPVLPILNDNIFGIQCVGGTGALRLIGEFLNRNHINRIFLPHLTWPNHCQIFTYAGMHIETYPYYDEKQHILDFSSMCAAIRKMPSSSVIVLHACCHNPTSVDPTPEQWRELSALIKKHQIIPLFDLAYQGFGTGVEEDVYGVGYFAEQGHEMFIASSYAKNFGLYGERAGFVALIANDKESTRCVASHLKQIARSTYSNPPLQAERIVKTILESKALTDLWKQELTAMRERLNHIRKTFSSGLIKRGKENYAFLEGQKGMFAFLGLSEEQVMRLRNEHGLYLAARGRANLAGINPDNIETVINAISSVLP